MIQPNLAFVLVVFLIMLSYMDEVDEQMDVFRQEFTFDEEKDGVIIEDPIAKPVVVFGGTVKFLANMGFLVCGVLMLVANWRAKYYVDEEDPPSYLTLVNMISIAVIVFIFVFFVLLLEMKLIRQLARPRKGSRWNHYNATKYLS